MILSVQQIKYELLAYMKEFGGSFGEWHIGVASDPLAMLAQVYGIDPQRGLWIYKQALTSRAALTVRTYFVDKLGASGDPPNDPVDEDCDCVYAWRRPLPGEILPWPAGADAVAASVGSLREATS